MTEENKTSKPVVEDAVVETPVEEVAEVVEQKVITKPESEKSVPTLGYNENGVIGSTTTKGAKPKSDKAEVPADAKPTKVAVYSERNLYADGFGKITVGYNIVPKKYADFWVTQRGVRLATPEEVAEAFA
jgi:hypothetical protein